MKTMAGHWPSPARTGPHPRGPDAHEHLHEVRARDREERHAGLAGDSARQQRLAGAGRSEEQHPLDLRAHRLELRRVLQVVLDFLQLLDRFVDTGHVAERGLRLVLGDGLVLAATELHPPAPPPCDRFITNSRMPPIRSTGRITVISVPSNVRLLRIHLGPDAGFLQQRGEVVGVLGRVRRAVSAAVGELAGDRLIAVMDHRVGDPATLDLGLELVSPSCSPAGARPMKEMTREEDSVPNTIQSVGVRAIFFSGGSGCWLSVRSSVGEVTSGPHVGAGGPVRPMVAPASDEEDPRFPRSADARVDRQRDLGEGPLLDQDRLGRSGGWPSRIGDREHFVGPGLEIDAEAAARVGLDLLTVSPSGVATLTVPLHGRSGHGDP